MIRVNDTCEFLEEFLGLHSLKSLSNDCEAEISKIDM